jgi:hypothetical protein
LRFHDFCARSVFGGSRASPADISFTEMNCNTHSNNQLEANRVKLRHWPRREFSNCHALHLGYSHGGWRIAGTHSASQVHTSNPRLGDSSDETWTNGNRSPSLNRHFFGVSVQHSDNLAVLAEMATRHLAAVRDQLHGSLADARRRPNRRESYVCCLVSTRCPRSSSHNCCQSTGLLKN